MTTIDLNTGDQLLLVPVSMEATNIHQGYKRTIHWRMPHSAHKEQFDDDVELLGCFYSPERRIDFAERVKESWVDDCPYYAKMWRNYNSDNKRYSLEESCGTKEESFISLLLSSKVEGEDKYLVLIVKK